MSSEAPSWTLLSDGLLCDRSGQTHERRSLYRLNVTEYHTVSDAFEISIDHRLLLGSDGELTSGALPEFTHTIVSD